MTSRAKLEKVLEELQRNPYYDKYAGKIARLQQTSPEEFLQRVEQQEKTREKQGIGLPRGLPGLFLTTLFPNSS